MADNGKIEVVGPINRATIQDALTPKVQEAVNAMIEELGMSQDPSHVRRTARALVHLAAKIALENGCQLDGWAYIAKAAWAKESTHESRGEAVLLVDQLGFAAKA